MKSCVGCGQLSPIAATFCTACGAPLVTSQSLSTGRPVISMGTPGAVHQPQPTVQPHNQFGAVPSTHTQQSSPKSSNKVIAVVVFALVVVVAGVLIFAGGSNKQPEQARPSSAQQVPKGSYSSWDDFPEWYRSNFLEGCTTETSYVNCVCALETLEANFTLDEVLEVEAADSAGEDVGWFYERIAAQCI